MASPGSRPWLFAAAVFTAVVLPVVLLPSWLSRNAESAAIEEELDWIRRRGEPVSAQQLSVDRVPPGEDACPLYERAAAAWEGLPVPSRIPWPDYDLERLPIPASLAPDQRDHLRAWIDDRRDLLATMREAASRPGCSSWKAGAARLGNPPVLWTSVYLSRLCLVAAESAAADGDLAGAEEVWTAALRVVRWPAGDPCRIGSLIPCVVIESGALDSLERLVTGSSFPEDALARFQSEVALLDPGMGMWRRSLCGGRISIVMTLRQLEGGETPSLEIGRKYSLGAVKRDVLLLLQYYREMQTRCEAGATDLSPFEKPFKAASGHSPLAALFLGGLGKTHNVCLALEIRGLVARWGLQLERHRIRSGGYPASLAGLDPGLRGEVPDPLDPFTGKELDYRLEDHGFRLCSLGPDRVDNGGRSDYSAGKYDVVWRR